MSVGVCEGFDCSCLLAAYALRLELGKPSYFTLVDRDTVDT